MAELKRQLKLLGGSSSEPETMRESSSGTEFRSYPTTSGPETEAEPDEYSSNLSYPDQCSPDCVDPDCDKIHERTT